MKSISSSTDVHSMRYTEKRNLIQRIRRVSDIKKVASLEESEKVKMPNEDKEKKDKITPQEAFRREISCIQNSPVYRKLQNKENNKEEKQEDNELDK